MSIRVQGNVSLAWSLEGDSTDGGRQFSLYWIQCLLGPQYQVQSGGQELGIGENTVESHLMLGLTVGWCVKPIPSLQSATSFGTV